MFVLPFPSPSIATLDSFASSNTPSLCKFPSICHSLLSSSSPSAVQPTFPPPSSFHLSPLSLSLSLLTYQLFTPPFRLFLLSRLTPHFPPNLHHSPLSLIPLRRSAYTFPQTSFTFHLFRSLGSHLSSAAIPLTPSSPSSPSSLSFC